MRERVSDALGRIVVWRGTVPPVGSPGRRKGRRTRSDDRRRHAAGPTLGAGPTYDPPWKSISEGRGLPRTAAFRAMVPIVLVAAVFLLTVVLVAGTISYFVG
jgi:hypothetical protein